MPISPPATSATRSSAMALRSLSTSGAHNPTYATFEPQKSCKTYCQARLSSDHKTRAYARTLQLHVHGYIAYKNTDYRKVSGPCPMFLIKNCVVTLKCASENLHVVDSGHVQNQCGTNTPKHRYITLALRRITCNFHNTTYSRKQKTNRANPFFNCYSTAIL